MKKTAYVLLALIVLYALATRIVPPIIDSQFNPVEHAAPYSYSDEAGRIHQELGFVGDLHCDALLWDRNLLKHNDRGQVDIPRMQQGNVALQAFTLVTKSPKGQNMQSNDADSDRITSLFIAQGRPVESWFSLYERAVAQCRQLHEFAAMSEGAFRVIRTQTDLRLFIDARKKDRSLTAGFLGVEGAHCLEGKLENVDGLWNEGVRMMAATHFFDNELGGSAHGRTGEGLTPFGEQAISRMDELGMILDVAHVSEQMVDDILALTDSPIITSHTGVKGMLNSPRNLSDKHLKAIAARNGLVGIAFFKGAIGDTSPKRIVETMKYVKDMIGAEYVALGSDYDGSVSTYFDCTGFPLLVDEMLQQGFTETEIRGIMGGNMQRFLLENLPA